jgi:hypothetical protein
MNDIKQLMTKNTNFLIDDKHQNKFHHKYLKLQSL